MIYGDFGVSKTFLVKIFRISWKVTCSGSNKFYFGGIKQFKTMMVWGFQQVCQILNIFLILNLIWGFSENSEGAVELGVDFYVE